MRRQRFTAAIVAALCIAANVTVAASAYADAAASPSPSGSVDTSTLLEPTSDSALLNLLGQQGVRYYPVTDSTAAVNYGNADATLVIDEDERPTELELADLRAAGYGRVIILGINFGALNAFMPGASVSAYSGAVDISAAPACTFADAVAAGSVDLHGLSAIYAFDTAGSETIAGCYPVNGSPTLAYAQMGAGDVVALGSATFFENNALASAGNAALALRLFGAHPQLVWFAQGFAPDPSLNNCSGGGCDAGQNNPGPVPTATFTVGGGSGGGGGGSSASRPTLSSLMPSWIWWMLLQLLVAVLLVAYWRGRRLGAVVSEQLPVAVRAAETVEGHARLYRRANAHGRAAELLRKATAGRLAGYFGVPAARAHADPSVLVAPVAARLGVTEDLVADLLTGDAPQSEAELVLLADHLDQLEQEVRSS